MSSTSNFEKHQHRNPIQRKLINRFYEQLYAMIQPLNPKSVLDVGCGEGVTLNNLYERGIGKQLEGVDFLHTAIEIGTKHFPHLNLKEGDIYKLPYRDDSFDVVLCNEVLEHLEDPNKAIQELIRVSKRYLILSVPNEPFFMMAQFFRGRHVTRWGNHPEHIQHWTMNGFGSFVTGHNLKIKQKQHPFSWTLVLAEK